MQVVAFWCKFELKSRLEIPKAAHHNKRNPDEQDHVDPVSLQNQPIFAEKCPHMVA
jgi:hypothetical protein